MIGNLIKKITRSKPKNIAYIAEQPATMEEAITRVIHQKLADGTVEKIVEERLVKALDSAIQDVFNWGDVGKVLKEKIKDVMVPTIEQHNFGDYTVKLDQVLTDIVNKTSLVDNKHILENFKNLMIDPVGKNIKLSDIFKEYKKHVAKNVDTFDLETHCEDGDPYYESVNVSLVVERDGDRFFKSSRDRVKVIFDCDHDSNEELKYTLTLYKSEGKEEWSILYTGLSSQVDINSLRDLSDFEIFILKLDRVFCKIEMDIEDNSDEVEPTAKPEWDLR